MQDTNWRQQIWNLAVNNPSVRVPSDLIMAVHVVTAPYSIMGMDCAVRGWPVVLPWDLGTPCRAIPGTAKETGHCFLYPPAPGPSLFFPDSKNHIIYAGKKGGGG